MTKSKLRNYIAITVVTFYLVVSALLLLWPIVFYELDAEDLNAYKQYSAHFLQAGVPGLLMGVTGYLFGYSKSKQSSEQEAPSKTDSRLGDS